MFNLVWSTDLLMPHLKVRVKVVAAVLLTFRSLPTQTVTVWLAEPVVPMELVVKVAVLLWVVHVPAGSWNEREYVNVFGLGSVYETVPRLPPSVSVTTTLPSTIVVGVLNAT